MKHLSLCLVLTAGVLSSGCVAPTKARVAAMMVGNAAIICDWGQTRWMNGGHDKWDRGKTEQNPLLGSTPTMTQINTAIIGALVVNTALTFMLKPKWATAFSFSVATIETANVLTQPSNPAHKWHKQGICRF